MKMKKLLLALLFVFSLAYVTGPSIVYAAGLPKYVYDSAGLLTASQQETLERKAAQIAAKYNCEARIITVDSIGGMKIEQVANAFYFDYNLGIGSDRSLVLLLLSMEDRDYDFAAWGFADYAFTEYGKDVILGQHILPALKKNNYNEAFNAFLDKTDEYFALASGGKPFDRDWLKEKLGVVILLPLLIAGGLCFMWKSQMKTAVTARAAHQYIPPGGFNLTGQQDQFLYRRETRTKIEKSSGSSSRSGGGSHRSGKF